MNDKISKVSFRMHLSTVDKDTRERVAKVAQYQDGGNNALRPEERVVLYLRSVAARSTYILPSFYYHLGAKISRNAVIANRTTILQTNEDVLERVLIKALAVEIRAIYDEKKRPLSAKTVTNMSAETERKLIEYWGRSSKAAGDDIGKTVAFIQRFLARCVLHENEVSKSNCTLARRISLMRTFADRDVAHISLQNYEFDIFDVMHVAAATAVFGAVINQYDNRDSWPPSYFQKGDRVAYEAARSIFPALGNIEPLFGAVDCASLIRQVSLGLFRPGEEHLSLVLPSALGWDGLHPTVFGEMVNT